jgi:hypothetical protein
MIMLPWITKIKLELMAYDAMFATVTDRRMVCIETAHLWMFLSQLWTVHAPLKDSPRAWKMVHGWLADGSSLLGRFAKCFDSWFVLPLSSIGVPRIIPRISRFTVTTWSWWLARDFLSLTSARLLELKLRHRTSPFVWEEFLSALIHFPLSIRRIGPLATSYIKRKGQGYTRKALDKMLDMQS